MAFPKEGKVPSIAREARWSEADEDVGTLFVGNCFDVRLRAGVRFPIVDCGSREDQGPPLPVCAPSVINRGWRAVPRALFRFLCCLTGHFVL